jgi:hypothetical protein
MKTLDSIYQVNIPSIDVDTKRFNFIAELPDGNFTFYFWYFNNNWTAFIQLPSGEIRNIGVYNNVLNWNKFLDYSVLILNATDEILQSDIANGNLQILIIKWTA